MTGENADTKGYIGGADAGEADGSRDRPHAHAQRFALCHADNEDPSAAFLGRFHFLLLC